MKQIILLVLVSAILICGCSSGQNDAAATPDVTATPAVTAPVTETPSVSMYDLRTAMLEQDKSLPEMLSVSNVDENAADLFGYLSDVDYSKVECFFLSYAADGSAYEIAVVGLRDENDMQEMIKSLNAHLENRVNLYRNYAPAEMEKARAAKVVSCGRYAALIMCQEQEAVRQAFESGVK